MQLGPWKCDFCGKPIEKIEDGWVEWLSPLKDKSAHTKSHGLRLVHHKPASDVPTREGCQYNEQDEYRNGGVTVKDLAARRLVGSGGLMHLLEFIALDDLPKEEVLEMTKRLHIPGYEQVREHMSEAINEGVVEPNRLEGYYSNSQIESALEWVNERKQEDID